MSMACCGGDEPPLRPCCAEHPDACPMCRRPWDALGDATGEECWICWRLCPVEPRP